MQSLRVDSASPDKTVCPSMYSSKLTAALFVTLDNRNLFMLTLLTHCGHIVEVSGTPGVHSQGYQGYLLDIRFGVWSKVEILENQD